jgi:hypothetical protein
LHEFATAIEQLAHGTYPTLPEDHIKREEGKSFADRAEHPAIKIQLMLGKERVVMTRLASPSGWKTAWWNPVRRSIRPKDST